MLYFDTSLLVPRVLPEQTSDAITGFFRELPAGESAVCHWNRVEFASLLAREVRIGNLTIAAAATVAGRFASMVLDAFAVLLPGAADFVLARTFLAGAGNRLRAGHACTWQSRTITGSRRSTAWTRPC